MNGLELGKERQEHEPKEKMTIEGKRQIDKCVRELICSCGGYKGKAKS